MQVELNEINERLAADYRRLAQQKDPCFAASTTTIVNAIFNASVKEAIAVLTKQSIKSPNNKR